MALDNRTLRTSHTKQKYVVVALVGGTKKYVARYYYRKHDFQYTVLLNKAYKGDSQEHAKKVIEWLGLEGRAWVFPVEVKMEVLKPYD